MSWKVNEMQAVDRGLGMRQAPVRPLREPQADPFGAGRGKPW